MPTIAEPMASDAPAPSEQSRAGLDWLNFFVANVQTGFGPFIAVYLTSRAWTQVNIGLALTIGGLVALAGQIPGGAIVDIVRSKRLVAGVAMGAIAASALMLALWPVFLAVVASEILHSLASCLLGPALAAISLGLVGHAAIGERLGRNASFASLGNGIAAALMGACGRLFSDQAVFLVTAVLAVPALMAVSRIRSEEIDPLRARGGARRGPSGGLPALLTNLPLVIFSGCILLFHFANAAMLPLMASIVTMRSSDWATVLIAACIVVPQAVVAVSSAWVGRQAQRIGRRPMLLLGFVALVIRGALFAVISSPYLLVVVQLLDGVSAAVIGVMLPLVVADTTRGSGRFNFALGVVGSTAGIGAAISTTFAGYISDHLGSRTAFLSLALIAAVGLAAVYRLMPETRARTETPP